MIKLLKYIIKSFVFVKDAFFSLAGFKCPWCGGKPRKKTPYFDKVICSKCHRAWTIFTPDPYPNTRYMPKEYFEERAREKQRSREKDAEDLRTGRKTVEEINRKNSMFPPGTKFRVDLKSSKRLS